MLYVAMGNAPLQSSLGPKLLITGGALGVSTIPVYFIGYLGCRSLFFQASMPADRRLLMFAALLAFFGVLTHGLTAVDIHTALSSGATTRRPQEAFAAFSPLVLTGISAVLACAGANLVLFLGALRSNRRLGSFPYLNPICATIALNAVAMVIGEAGEFLAPAAPNLAHVIFFAACAQRMKSSPTVD